MTMRRLAGMGLCLAVAAATLAGVAAAQDPFTGGAVVSEGGRAATGSGGGWFSDFLDYVYLQQTLFYERLQSALAGMADSGEAFWVLGGISLAYGIFHAAGPGHGKFVISTYVLANRQSARRGVVLAFMAALLQAVVAVALVGIGAAILNQTSAAMTQTQSALEIGSYALIAALGAWLLWSRALWPALARVLRRRTPRAAALSAGVAHTGHDHARDDHGQSAHHHHDHDHHGHAHWPDPAQFEGRLEPGKAAAAVLSVGLRPCYGTIIVLVFALSQDIFAVGVASTFVMAIGTGITVAALVAFAVSARAAALKVVGRHSRFGHVIGRTVEIGGAAAVFLIGATLLLAAVR
jgi:ABC-type nickel/cobalt efflux system permease component RcnA